MRSQPSEELPTVDQAGAQAGAGAGVHGGAQGELQDGVHQAQGSQEAADDGLVS